MAHAPQDQIAPLLTPEGWDLLASLGPYRDEDSFELNSALRKAGHPAGLVSAVLTQSRLRTRAEAKFGEFARQMLFTQAGLEQATRLNVAAHHAQRFAAAGISRVADLGCGLGADAMALASLDINVTAVEMDETTAACATMNLIPFPNATVVHADAASVPLEGIDGVWLDPARRVTSTSGTKRIWDPEAFSPPLSFVESLAAGGKAVGVKMGPGMPHESVPAGCEAQWVSVAGDVTEVTLWFNAVRRPAVRRAALVLGSQGPAELTSADDFGAGPAAPVGPVEGYLYEPDGAVIRAGLVADVALQLGGHLVDEHIAYICAPDLSGHPVRPGLQGPGGHALQRQGTQGLGEAGGHHRAGYQEARHRGNPGGTAEAAAASRKELQKGFREDRHPGPDPYWGGPGGDRGGTSPAHPESSRYCARMNSSAARTCSAVGRTPV
ncbi:hypothetical protein QFZ60_001133 [Arthrobacter sp. B2I5]|nr:hypothetical protein [Arthrobacter sp. B2I5]